MTDNLDVDSKYGIKYKRPIIPRMVMRSYTRGPIACTSCLQCSGMESIDLGILYTFIRHNPKSYLWYINGTKRHTLRGKRNVVFLQSELEGLGVQIGAFNTRNPEIRMGFAEPNRVGNRAHDFFKTSYRCGEKGDEALEFGQRDCDAEVVKRHDELCVKLLLTRQFKNRFKDGW